MQPLFPAFMMKDASHDPRSFRGQATNTFDAVSDVEIDHRDFSEMEQTHSASWTLEYLTTQRSGRLAINRRASYLSEGPVGDFIANSEIHVFEPDRYVRDLPRLRISRGHSSWCRREMVGVSSRLSRQGENYSAEATVDSGSPPSHTGQTQYEITELASSVGR
jgi:hypothetical protein